MTKLILAVMPQAAGCDGIFLNIQLHVKMFSELRCATHPTLPYRFKRAAEVKLGHICQNRRKYFIFKVGELRRHGRPVAMQAVSAGLMLVELDPGSKTWSSK